MPAILSIGEAPPQYEIPQSEVMNFSRQLFSNAFHDIERLLKAFQHGQIKKRHFARSIEWFEEERSFKEKNDAYIETAIQLGAKAIENCLHNKDYLKKPVDYEDIDAIFTISSTGLATPSIEARIMNILPFSIHTKRIPIWGLGCAGGASGLSRAYEYCLAFPHAKVLVLTIELCSLTFQKNDLSKSNLIGSSLFADGVACALVVGDRVQKKNYRQLSSYPTILATQTTTMKDSLDVMGWEVKEKGLYVVFSKDIPSIIEKWLKPNVYNFLYENDCQIENLQHFVAHPGGKKVLEAYMKSLQFPSEMLEISTDVLKNYGNMSSATILYVLNRTMKMAKEHDMGLATALGPGFSSELLLLQWRAT
ncbi:type III polyketide synthase [Robertmurraya korlensis]|jgi:alkylresorcinol/alkylpyrone synthase|uniref:type III polyketide synthase n=1 Tax=Robertmurraya korlensis TaxID=519977 RepID=UPI0008271E43|nr:3-oxoacyl-[acyl-carrier-protein] synthase III C-terminal domain-containing protein [Robertmurraya korlensis]